MSFGIVFTERAAKQFVALPESVQSAVQPFLDQLADDPLACSRRASSPPYRPGGQVFEVYLAGPRNSVLVTFFFLFSVDETDIVVQSIGYIEYAAPPPGADPAP